MKYMFFPYLIYLVIICYNSGHLMGDYIENLQAMDKPHYIHSQAGDNLKRSQRIRGIGLTALAMVFLFCFASLEVGQMKSSGWEYFADVWNCIDITSACLNLVFSGMFMSCLITDTVVFSFADMHTVAAFACFFMWLKVFYWCRLFSSLAYYVKLIQQTIGDSLYFMFMVLVILISFGSFLYVSDRMLDGTGKSYLGEYFNNKMVDSVVSVYMLGALSDFDTGRYKVGQARYFVMFMFILATFIVSVVFLNMLIAIMGETFGQVLEGAEENGLREQVVLITDHLWLLDLQKIFKGQKYILQVGPSTSAVDDEEPALNAITSTQDFIGRKIEHLNSNMERRIDTVETNTTFMLENQYSAIDLMMGRLRDMDEQIAMSADKAEERHNELNPDASRKKVSSTDLKIKKRELQRAINADSTHVGKLTHEKVQQMATSYVNLVDADQNGLIEKDEFIEFFTNFDGICLSDEEITYLFKEADKNGGGHLSIQEFAEALFKIIVPEGFEDMDEK